jgi:murein DD-endopeptidase MepM/ murein hydrolase activator NlpD
VTYVLCCAAALLAGVFVTAAASAATGGATPRPKVPKAAAPPVLTDVRCVSDPIGGCVEPHRVAPGGTVTVLGRSAAGATQLVFYGQKGSRDDVLAPLVPVAGKLGTAVVPPKAASGAMAVVDSAGRRSRRWIGMLVEGTNLGFGSYQAPGIAAPVQVAVSEPRTIFFGGMQRAVFNFRVSGTSAVDLRVDLVSGSNGAVVQSWNRRAAAPGTIQRLAWNGGAKGKVLPDGRYGFQVSAPGVTAARTASVGPERAVTVYGHMFPILGPHTYGMSAGRFGAGRSGHTHQGQDVMARCGTPLVAARGGRVLYSGFHALAGYYVVIDGKSTGRDYAYMHLRQPSLLRTGQSVSTGQQLGEVGETGDAQGCHLHFEQWSAPGWYRGGRPFDPLPDLRKWDAVS